MAGWKTSDKETWKKSILVTGGAGFIGSNFIEHYLHQRPDHFIVNLDKLTYAGNRENVVAFDREPNYVFYKGDVCDGALLASLFKTHNITDVIHFAAESHVDNAIDTPDPFIQTNILGTYELLKTAKQHWLSQSERRRHRFHHISTDEVYGTLSEADEAFTEASAYTPNNPYSASKASAAHLVRSYARTYGMDVIITNCSNNYGPKQHKEKLIPTIISKALAQEEIPIYGDGKQIRDWLHVKDHCHALELVFEQGQAGETYNVGGRNEQINLLIAETICDLLDELKPIQAYGMRKNYRELIKFVQDRPGHDRRYSINPEKIEKELGWRPQTTLADGLRETVEWYVNDSAV